MGGLRVQVFGGAKGVAARKRSLSNVSRARLSVVLESLREMWQAGKLLTREGRKNVRWSCSWWRESTSWYATASFGLLPFFASWVTLRLACDRSIRAGTSIAFPCHHHGAQAAAREGRRWRCREAADEECRKDAEKTQKNAEKRSSKSVSLDVFLRFRGRIFG